MNSKPRLAESIFGWDRNTVILGLHELFTGIRCIDDFQARGNIKAEEKNKRLETDICDLAEPNSQTDPKFQTRFKYTRITAKGMREALKVEKGWADQDLPCEKTISNMLNRLGYRFTPCSKSKTNQKNKRYGCHICQSQ